MIFLFSFYCLFLISLSIDFKMKSELNDFIYKVFNRECYSQFSTFGDIINILSDFMHRGFNRGCHFQFSIYVDIIFNLIEACFIELPLI